MPQTITIELRTDFDTSEKKDKEPMMLKLAQQHAQELLSTASLLSGKRPPTIAIQCGDFFSDTKDIELFDKSGE